MFSWLSTAGRKLFSTVLVRLGLTMTPVSTVGVNCSSCLPLFHDSTIFLVCYHLHTHSTLIASLSPWYSMSSTGDSDTLNTSLLKPYPDRSDNSARVKTYNKKLSSTRVVVENANVRLKNKWRRLKKVNVLTSEKARLIVRACIVLHNYVLKHDTVVQPTCDSVEYRIQNYDDATSKRDAISRFLSP